MQLMAAAVLTDNGNGLIFHLFHIADIPRFSLDKQSVLYFSAAENNRLALLFARKLSHKQNSIQTWSLEIVCSSII